MNSMEYIIKCIEINRQQVNPEITDSTREEQTINRDKHACKHVSFAKKLAHYEPRSDLTDFIDENHYDQRNLLTKSFKVLKNNFKIKFGFNFHMKGIDKRRRKVIPTLPLTYNNLNRLRISNNDVD